jgi:hypothetical protein
MLLPRLLDGLFIIDMPAEQWGTVGVLICRSSSLHMGLHATQSFHHNLPSSFVVCAPILSLNLLSASQVHSQACITSQHRWTSCFGVGEGVVAHGPDLSLVGVLPLLVPPPVRLCLLLLLFLKTTTSRRSGLAIQLALVSPVVLLGRLVLQTGGETIDQGSQCLQVFLSARVG